jgi:adenine-specific DNA-methyltransferase
MSPYYSDNFASVFRAKAEQFLPTLPDKSVNLIATDPPFCGVKDEEWDNRWESPEAYLAWLGVLCVQWRRVLKPNGSLYVFASPEMSARVEVEVRKHFEVLNRIAWRKQDGSRNEGGLWSRADKETLRRFFEQKEEIIFAEPPVAWFEPIRLYLEGERVAAGLTYRDVNRIIGKPVAGGGMASHYFSDPALLNSLRWQIPTQEHYESLQRATGRFARSYVELKGEFDERRRHFAVDVTTPFTDVWDFPTVQAYAGKHPCEKPLSLMEHIVRTSSRPGDVVLDCFCGYGATVRAAKSMGRQAIGVDEDERCCRVTADRLRQGILFASEPVAEAG